MSSSPMRFRASAGHFCRSSPKPAVEHLADLFWSGHQFSRLSDPHHLEGRLADRVFQPHIHEIQVKHTQERVEQGMNNLSMARHRSTWQEERGR